MLEGVVEYVEFEGGVGEVRKFGFFNDNLEFVVVCRLGWGAETEERDLLVCDNILTTEDVVLEALRVLYNQVEQYTNHGIMERYFILLIDYKFKLRPNFHP